MITQSHNYHSALGFGCKSLFTIGNTYKYVNIYIYEHRVLNYSSINHNAACLFKEMIKVCFGFKIDDTFLYFDDNYLSRLFITYMCKHVGAT